MEEEEDLEIGQQLIMTLLGTDEDVIMQRCNDGTI
jgi:hypothetical protein